MLEDVSTYAHAEEILVPLAMTYFNWPTFSKFRASFTHKRYNCDTEDMAPSVSRWNSLDVYWLPMFWFPEAELIKDAKKWMVSKVQKVSDYSTASCQGAQSAILSRDNNVTWTYQICAPKIGE